MKAVYEASNTLEAQMMLNIIEHAGVNGKIEGGDLQGGIGEIQAMGIVKVMVEEHYADHAKQIIAEWEAERPAETPSYNKFDRLNFGFVFWLIGGIIFGLYLVNLFVN